ncbi:glycerol-3-phosphate dehydrogenase [Candidatus Scalindua japonica]|uniref:Glycerol-3-phosphate dehydrogenase n=1 Tax=Candidatus Scalindua japonica TaxID=1284222 RepID=A0A286U1A8_9BACT|nr:hypothetical protein [Candidatus Scalindua japonica]GAX61919.1 glycerol-3-phosphate dehydrogenase [Candidatus Scalindua japonica]
MKQVFRLCCNQYSGTKRVGLCIALTIGSLLFITDYCKGQASDQPVEYETPGVIDAYEILPPNLLEGKDFWMGRRVVSYGLNNRYTINSHFGKFEANGEEMLHGYHTHVKPIKELVPVRKFAVGYTSDQTVVATFPIDLLYWTELADLGSTALVKLDLTGRPIKKTELWFTGSVTLRAMQELNARGLVINERAGEVLMPVTDQ